LTAGYINSFNSSAKKGATMWPTVHRFPRNGRSLPKL
jgi:hypothetical protein